MATTEEKPKDLPLEISQIESAQIGGKPDAVLAESEAKGQVLSGYEDLGAIATIRKFKRAFGFCLMATFAAACDGYQIGLNGNVIANEGFVDQFATTTNDAGERILAAPVLTAIGTIQSVGQIIGMTLMPFLTARFGRKAGMYVLWLWLVVSVLCESLARHWAVWMIGKLFSGIGVGSMQFITPIYVSELAPVRIRGILLMFYSFWFSLGQFMASIALQSLNSSDPDDYLTAVYTQWSQIGLMAIVYILLPESPAWCANKNKEERGKKNMRRIYKGVEGYDVDHQWHVLTAVVEHEAEVARIQKNESWVAVFKGVNGFRTIVSCWPLVSQQVLGLTLFSTYSAYFFRIAGLEDPFTATAINSGLGIAALVFAACTVEKIGRRLLNCVALTIMLVMNLGVGILGVVPANDAVNKLLVVFTVFWSMAVAVNGATGWGYIGEISSQRLRAHTAGFGAALSAVLGVIMNVLVPYMLNENEWNWNLKTAFFYLGVGAPFAIGAWFIVPETAGRSAAELDELFENKVKPFRFHKTVTATQRANEARREQHRADTAALNE